ncbi:MAG TPA: NYN domain-containing protein [Candidatus Paceibacterota bacterium]|nr:NYN domain-containing protein [Candidatus Paceibacterota bacterium]
MKQAPPNYSNQRVGIFVDVQNLYHSAKNLHHARVNYAELMKHLVGDRQLIRALAYVIKSEGIEPPRSGGASRQGSAMSAAAAQHERDAAAQQNGVGQGSSEAGFFEALEKAGLELRMKDLQIFAGGMKKADWDVGMAVDAIRMSPFLDAVILVTGDGDFLPLVDYLKWGAGRLVEVAAFRRSASAKIQEAADKFINIEDVPRAIMKSGRMHGHGSMKQTGTTKQTN